MNRKQQLEKEILKHDKLYWELGTREISDPEYDNLVQELKSIEPDHYLVTRINTPRVSSKGKVKHKLPMMSLDKVYSVQELIDWAGKVKRHSKEMYLLEIKYDGWSIELNNNVMSTRGDGLEGDDISNKIIYIRDINGNELDPNSYIHGETIMMKSTFKKFKNKITRKTGEEYKTERTILQGLLGRDEINPEAIGILTLVPFNHVSIKVPFDNLIRLNWDEIIKNTKNSNYPADGLVLKIADQEYAKSLGATSHHLKSAMALKFGNPTGETVLRGVFFSMGKGVITPVGEIDPVEVGGVIIDSPNLHNYKTILDKDIHIGDTLIIERCGDVIPDVQKVIPGENRIKIELKNCPVCNAVVIYDDPFLKCTNPNCPGKHIKQLLDAVIRVGIDGLKEATLQKIVKQGSHKLADIFRLEKSKFLELDGFAKKKATKLYNEIQRVKNEGIYEWQLLASLNIPGIGRTLSTKILKDMTLNELRSKQPEDLIKLDNIGPERSLEIYNGLITYSSDIDELLSIINIKGEEIETEYSKTICFTGTFPEKKSYYENLAKKIGYKPLGKVPKDLTILVCSDPSKNSGKYKLAKKYGIPILSTEEFLEKVNGV